MASEVNSQTANYVIQSIVDGTADPNFCRELLGISARYKDKVRQCMSEFFAYLDDYE